MLAIKDIEPPQHHQLSELYDQLPDKVRKQLNDLFKKALGKNKITLEAFANTETLEAPEGPPNRDLRNLKGFCVYFDTDMKLSTKRYTWEMLSKAEWRHYLNNLDWVLRFLDLTEKYSEQLAQEEGLIK